MDRLNRLVDHSLQFLFWICTLAMKMNCGFFLGVCNSFGLFYGLEVWISLPGKERSYRLVNHGNYWYPVVLLVAQYDVSKVVHRVFCSGYFSVDHRVLCHIVPTIIWVGFIRLMLTRTNLSCLLNNLCCLPLPVGYLIIMVNWLIRDCQIWLHILLFLWSLLYDKLQFSVCIFSLSLGGSI